MAVGVYVRNQYLYECRDDQWGAIRLAAELAGRHVHFDAARRCLHVDSLFSTLAAEVRVSTHVAGDAEAFAQAAQLASETLQGLGAHAAGDRDPGPTARNGVPTKRLTVRVGCGNPPTVRWPIYHPIRGRQLAEAMLHAYPYDPPMQGPVPAMAPAGNSISGALLDDIWQWAKTPWIDLLVPAPDGDVHWVQRVAFAIVDALYRSLGGRGTWATARWDADTPALPAATAGNMRGPWGAAGSRPASVGQWSSTEPWEVPWSATPPQTAPEPATPRRLLGAVSTFVPRRVEEPVVPTPGPATPALPAVAGARFQPSQLVPFPRDTAYPAEPLPGDGIPPARSGAAQPDPSGRSAGRREAGPEIAPQPADLGAVFTAEPMGRSAAQRGGRRTEGASHLLPRRPPADLDPAKERKPFG